MSSSKQSKNKNVIREFNIFMRNHIVDNKDKPKNKKLPISHTDCGSPYKSYYISDEEYDDFLDLYTAVMGKKQLHLVERFGNSYGKFVVDIDFNYDTDYCERRYNEDTIKYTILKVISALKKYYKLTSEIAKAFVLEKKNPTFDKKKLSCKDGFHIIFPNVIISKDMRYLITEKTQRLVGEEDGFRHLNCKNPYDDIFDKTVAGSNGLTMYGSKKQNGGQYYHLTHVYKIVKRELVDIGIKKYNKIDLPEILSLRYSCENYLEPKKSLSPIVLEKEIYNALPQTMRKKRNSTSSSDSNQKRSKSKQRTSTTPKKKCTNRFELAISLVEILDDERAEHYSDWIRVGWALHTISDELLDCWKEFSQRYSEKYDEQDCEKRWDDMRDEGLGLKSLHIWAATDNPEEYRKLMSKQVNKLVLIAERGTDYSIALVVYELYKHKFVCSSIKHKTWYEFQDHRWVEIDGGRSLRILISKCVTNEFLRLGIKYRSDALDKEGIEKDNLIKRATKMESIMKQLEKHAFKSAVMAECMDLFYQPGFEEKLDSKKHLIGFDNGVYDLENEHFRAGSPEDYITFTAGYNYIEYNKTHHYIKEIKEFFRKVQTEMDMREYILTLFASFLDGFTRQQRLIIWTGSGCHAKNSLIRMYDGSLKLVQNIKPDDKVMGDDSKPRTVKQLFKGYNDMYKVTNKLHNVSYTVNGDHRLALQIDFNPIVEIENKWCLKWLELTENKPILKTAFLNFNNENKKEKYQEVIKLLIKLHNINKNIVKRGEIFPVKVKDYINLSDEVKKCLKGFRTDIDYSSKGVFEDPYEYGKSVTEGKLELEYMLNSREIRNRLLGGIIDNLGTYFAKVNMYTLITKSEKLSGDIVQLAYSLGYTVRLNQDKDMFKIFIHGNRIHEIRSIFKARPNKLKMNGLINLNVEHIGKDNYYGFEVDNNNRYVLDDYTVTYNSNGKSTCVDFFQRAFGDYCGIFPTTVLTSKRGAASGATPEMADKKGKRFVIVQEPEGTDKINVGYMKELTGSDTVYARPLFKDPIKFKPQFKIILTCNKLPHIPSNDGGTWRRIRVSPFGSEFLDHDVPIRNAKKQFRKDFELEDKMEKWKAAFMWLLIHEYYIEKYKKSGYKISEPAKVKARTRRYQQESDRICEFLESGMVEITKDQKDYVKLNELYKDFKMWYRDAHESKAPSRNELVEYLEKYGLKMTKSKIFGMVYCPDSDLSEGYD